MAQAILATETGVDATALAQAVGAELVHPQEVAARLSQNSETRAVILVPSLASDLETSRSTQAALAIWSERIASVLELLRHNRRSVLLLDERDALAELKQSIVQIQAWIGGQADPEPLKPSSRAMPTPRVVLELSALALASSTSKTRRLADELEAALAPIYDLPDDPVALFQARIQDTLKEAEDSQAVAATQIESLRVALSFASENYAAAALDARDAAASIGDLRTAVELSAKNYSEAVESAQSLEEQAKKADAERNILLAEIKEHKARASAMTQDVADYKATLEEQAAQIKDLHDTQEELERALDATRTSTSWKVTAPIRAVKSALGSAEAGPDAERKE